MFFLNTSLQGVPGFENAKANIHWDNKSKKPCKVWYEGGKFNAINHCTYFQVHSRSSTQQVQKIPQNRFGPIGFALDDTRFIFSVITEAKKSWKTPYTAYNLTRSPDSDVDSDEDLNDSVQIDDTVQNEEDVSW